MTYSKETIKHMEADLLAERWRKMMLRNNERLRNEAKTRDEKEAQRIESINWINDQMKIQFNEYKELRTFSLIGGLIISAIFQNGAPGAFGIFAACFFHIKAESVMTEWKKYKEYHESEIKKGLE